MKKLIIFIIILIYSCDTYSVMDRSLMVNDKLPAYVLLGQSNARAIVTEGLAFYTAAPVFQKRHSGNNIQSWYTYEPHENYFEDVQFIHDSLGDEYYLKALFWFQGESNWNDYASFYTFSSNFFNALIAEFGDIDINIFLVWCTDPDRKAGIKKVREKQLWLNAAYSGVKKETKNYDRYDYWHLTDGHARKAGREMMLNYNDSL